MQKGQQRLNEQVNESRALFNFCPPKYFPPPPPLLLSIANNAASQSVDKVPCACLFVHRTNLAANNLRLEPEI